MSLWPIVLWKNATFFAKKVKLMESVPLCVNSVSTANQLALQVRKHAIDKSLRSLFMRLQLSEKVIEL